VTADAALLLYGVSLLFLVTLVGILRPKANRARPASQPTLWLVRSAFVWLAVGGGLMVYFGADASLSGTLLSQSEFDAIRHTLGVGVLTNLVLGMSLLILPEFAVERQRRNRQRPLALVLAVLINLSALLRTLPPIIGSHLTPDERNISMALAGSIAEAAMLVFTVYVLRLVLSRQGVLLNHE
jgi:hypothetical protein